MSRHRLYDEDAGYSSSRHEKPCRACVDINTFMSSQGKGGFLTPAPNEGSDHQCPLDKNELGRKSWALLHTIAAYYQERPTPTQQQEMKTFFTIFSKIYPCKPCAEDMRRDLEDEPPITTSRHELSQWLCRLHNKVNNKLGKELFDCSTVDERWLHGWKDGSCG